LLRKISLFQNTKESFSGKKINLAKKFFNLAKKADPFQKYRFPSHQKKKILARKKTPKKNALYVGQKAAENLHKNRSLRENYVIFTLRYLKSKSINNSLNKKMEIH
jgi:hypothetical protein